MTTALILLLLATVALAAVAVVRAVRRDPALRIPCSSCDAFVARWADGPVSRWSV